MDDNQTQQALDALADLFLTGTTPTISNTGPAVTGNPPPVSDIKATQIPPEAIRELDGPTPLRMPPQANRPPEHESEIVTAILDEPLVPQLKFTGEQPTSQAKKPTAISARIEVVILGHLPGFGGPWLTQYAHDIAKEIGNVAVLHIDDDDIDLELVAARGELGAKAAHEAAAELIEGITDRSLGGLMRAMTHDHVACLLIHFTDPTSPAQAQHINQFNRWTLVCGDYETAIVSGATMINDIINVGSDRPADDLDIGVVVMGADEHESSNAAARINELTLAQSSTPTALRAWRKQMVPVSTHSVGRFSLADDQNASWQSFFDNEPQTVQPVQVVVEIDDELFEDALDQEEIIALNQSASETHIDDLVAATYNPPREDVVNQPITAGSAGSFNEFDRPSEELFIEQDPMPEPSEEPELASLLMRDELDGSVMLDARCPHQSQTEIVLDQNGRMHLLRRHRSTAKGDVEGIRSALVDLIDTRAWVMEHFELLRLTKRQCQFDDTAEPTLHLFTDDARTAVTLVGRIGQFVRLHLLQQIKVGAESTWFCAPLN